MICTTWHLSQTKGDIAKRPGKGNVFSLPLLQFFTEWLLKDSAKIVKRSKRSRQNQHGIGRLNHFSILYLSRSHPIKNFRKRVWIFNSTADGKGFFFGWKCRALQKLVSGKRVTVTSTRKTSRLREHRHDRTLSTSSDDWIYAATNVSKWRARWEPRIDLKV